MQHRALLEVHLEDELRHSSALSSALRTAKQAMEKLFEVEREQKKKSDIDIDMNSLLFDRQTPDHWPA